jgi:RAB6A-GEF complex partner protein 1
LSQEYVLISASSYSNKNQTQLFIPQILHHHLSNFNSPSALYLCHEYSHLAYFSHALEILLHDILDHEVDNPPSPSNGNQNSSLLPSVITLISSFPQFLDIVVQCTRKTELRSWRTLFAHLPPARVLFERSLEQGRLKTAGGYLLVLHTLETSGGTPATSPLTMEDAVEGQGVSQQMVVRLLSRAAKEGDWGLGMELARFLVALDGTGDMLRGALDGVGLRAKVEEMESKSGGLDDMMINGRNSSGSSLGLGIS